MFFLVPPLNSYYEEIQSYMDAYADKHPNPIYGSAGLHQYTGADSYLLEKPWLKSGEFVYFLYSLNHRVFVGNVGITLASAKDCLRGDVSNVTFAIHPLYRGFGYGKELLNLAMDYAESLGLVEVWTSVPSDNIAASKLLESIGCRRMRTAKGLYVYRYMI